MPATTRLSALVAFVAILAIPACYGSVGSLCDNDYCGDAGLDARGDSAAESTSADSPSDAGPDVTEHDGGEASAGCTAPTTLDCNGTCVDPTLPSHCGSCNNVCHAPDAGSGQATCTAGTCGLGCSGSTSLDCAGACVDPSKPEHCGSCTNSCPAPGAGTGTTICTLGGDGGTCSVTCSGSTTEVCGDSCYAPTDPNHCGSCANACPPPPSGNGQASCASPPTCDVTCSTSYHACSADCLPNSDEPSDTSDPCVLTEAFGVFVSPNGSDSGAGTRAAPYATIGHAMDQAKLGTLTRIYACGTAGHYAENLVVGASRAGLTVYGGLDCTTTPGTWTYKAADLATIAPASGYAAQITAAVTFEDMGFVAAATTAANASTSSIAVFVSGATGVTMERCTMDAGAAAPGATPAQPPPYTTIAPTGNTGGAPIASGGTGMGGAELPNPDCPLSVGGAGGSAKLGDTSIVDGQSGQPGTTGNGGKSIDCGASEQGGGVGVAGAAGAPGTTATTWATFSASGWTPSGGTTAGLGSVGQGGGGGGAQAATNGVGGGGGGGAGGCGGTGGTGGSGGGSSIGLLVFDASVTLQGCTIATANGAPGGSGAPGQAGQTGGPGGAGGLASCTGGMGGAGGNGGPGAGGSGGLSVGVLWTGTMPTVTGGSQTFGSAGAAGANGDGSLTAKPGTAGGVVQFQ